MSTLPNTITKLKKLKKNHNIFFKKIAKEKVERIRIKKEQADCTRKSSLLASL